MTTDFFSGIFKETTSTITTPTTSNENPSSSMESNSDVGIQGTTTIPNTSSSSTSTTTIVMESSTSIPATTPTESTVIYSSTVPSITESSVESSTSTSTAPQCNEDMDCWDCSTMGNHICGNAPVRESIPGWVPITYPEDYDWSDWNVEKYQTVPTSTPEATVLPATGAETIPILIVAIIILPVGVLLRRFSRRPNEFKA